ncbi:MAG: hypothetical protein ABI680_20575 [Chthoniobacteraceae bacterium]
MHQQSVAFPIIVSILLLLLIIPLLRKYSGVTFGKAILIGLLTGAAAAGAMIHFHETFRGPRGSDQLVLVAVSRALFIFFAVPFVIRIWRHWMGGAATEGERQPGAAGLSAWFSVANVIVGLALVVAGYLGYGVPWALLALVIAGTLAAYPLLRTPAPASMPAPESDPGMSAEREKIFSMLEAGKLTPEESAGLLDALNENARLKPRAPVPLDAAQRLLLIGAALVLVGFFLPWVTFNPGQVAGSLMAEMNANFPMNSFPGGNPMNGMELKTPTISIAGGDIKSGLGWMTLIMAIAAAALPYVTSALDSQTLRTVRFLCLGVGGIILLYLLTQNIRFVAIGMVLALGGYVLATIGVVRQQQAAQG